MKLIFISAVFALRVIRPYYDSSVALSLNHNKNVVELSSDSPGVISFINDDSDDGVELFIDGKTICIDDDLLRTCSDRKDKFRMKYKGNGFRLKTETRNFFSKLFFEKCLVREGRQLRMKGCEDIKEEMFFMDNMRDTRNEKKDDLCDKNPALCKDPTEKLPVLPNYPIFNSGGSVSQQQACSMKNAPSAPPMACAIQKPQQTMNNQPMPNNLPIPARSIVNIPMSNNPAVPSGNTACNLNNNPHTPGWNVSAIQC